MALIKNGSINDFNVKVKKTVKKGGPALRGIRTFSTLSEVSRATKPGSFELITSKDKRGISLNSIKLEKGFEGFLQKFLDPDNEIYFVAWAWDLSGEPINQYPGANADPNDVKIPLKVGTVREFIGEGINLFPKRKVKGGVAIRIQLWESDDNTRNFGKAMKDMADAVEKSQLNNLLNMISMGTGVSGATVTLVKEAAIELTKVIGTILQANGDDYVDFYEGYYAADQEWKTGNESFTAHASVLTLRRY